MSESNAAEARARAIGALRVLVGVVRREDAERCVDQLLAASEHTPALHQAAQCAELQGQLCDSLVEECKELRDASARHEKEIAALLDVVCLPMGEARDRAIAELVRARG